jgi:hypothetical protein
MPLQAWIKRHQVQSANMLAKLFLVACAVQEAVDPAAV